MTLPRLPFVVALSLAAAPAHAFCGFYVGKADAQLFNDARRWRWCATATAPCSP
jgi:hypothetical protein